MINPNDSLTTISYLVALWIVTAVATAFVGAVATAFVAIVRADVERMLPIWATSLVRAATRRLKDDGLRERYSEEWNGELESIPSHLLRLKFALGVYLTAPNLNRPQKRKSHAVPSVRTPLFQVRLFRIAMVLVWIISLGFGAFVAEAALQPYFQLYTKKVLEVLHDEHRARVEVAARLNTVSCITQVLGEDLGTASATLGDTRRRESTSNRVLSFSMTPQQEHIVMWECDTGEDLRTTAQDLRITRDKWKESAVHSAQVMTHRFDQWERALSLATDSGLKAEQEGARRKLLEQFLLSERAKSDIRSRLDNISLDLELLASATRSKSTTMSRPPTALLRDLSRQIKVVSRTWAAADFPSKQTLGSVN